MKPTLVGIKQGLQAYLIAHQALLLAKQLLCIVQQAHHTALCQPHHKRPKLTTSNTRLLLLIADKQRLLKDSKYSPEDHRDLQID